MVLPLLLRADVSKAVSLLSFNTGAQEPTKKRTGRRASMACSGVSAWLTTTPAIPPW